MRKCTGRLALLDVVSSDGRQLCTMPEDATLMRGGVVPILQWQPYLTEQQVVGGITEISVKDGSLIGHGNIWDEDLSEKEMIPVAVECRIDEFDLLLRGDRSVFACTQWHVRAVVAGITSAWPDCYLTTGDPQ